MGTVTVIVIVATVTVSTVAASLHSVPTVRRAKTPCRRPTSPLALNRRRPKPSLSSNR